MASQHEIEIAKKLFAAWSSGDADAPAAFLTEDAVLHDIVAGREKRGWPAIREFFAFALKMTPDLVLAPNAFWLSDEGVAVRWDMSGTVTNEMFGPGKIGRKWHSPGMSTLEFRGDRVCREVDYHHGGAPARSLEGDET